MKKITINLILVAWLGFGLYKLFSMITNPSGVANDSWGVLQGLLTWMYLLIFIFPSVVMLIKFNLEEKNFIFSRRAKFLILSVLGIFILFAISILN